MLRKLSYLVIFLLLTHQAKSQQFTLSADDGAKPFSLNIYFGTEGKGAYVQYHGQSGLIPLKIKSHKTSTNSTTPRSSYIWDEIVAGKVNGSYGLIQVGEQIIKAWYTRGKDGKSFALAQLKAPQEPKVQRYLIHGILISFYNTTENQLTFTYPDGKKEKSELPEFDHPDPQRRGVIADYNFDGYDDVAFSIPDAGMGVYRIFSIYLYQPNAKRFAILAEPNAPKANCDGLCDVTLDKKNKLLMSSCRGAATWWTDIYRFSHNNNLVWIKSTKQR